MTPRYLSEHAGGGGFTPLQWTTIPAYYLLTSCEEIVGPAGFCIAPSLRFYVTHQLTGRALSRTCGHPYVVAQEGLDRLKREGRK